MGRSGGERSCDGEGVLVQEAGDEAVTEEGVSGNRGCDGEVLVGITL